MIRRNILTILVILLVDFISMIELTAIKSTTSPSTTRNCLCDQVQVTCLSLSCEPNQVQEVYDDCNVCCPECVTLLRKCGNIDAALCIFNKFFHSSRCRMSSRSLCTTSQKMW